MNAATPNQPDNAFNQGPTDSALNGTGRNESMFMSNESHEKFDESGEHPTVLRTPDSHLLMSPLHRIADVRRLQGMSLRAARQALGVSSDEVRRQEDPHCDLLLSELRRWQEALDVPIAELLSEPSMHLSQPVSARAALVRVMKTATTILESARTPPIQTLAVRLIEQLREVMPELQGIAPWPSVGQRRTLDEMGRIAENPCSFAPPED